MPIRVCQLITELRPAGAERCVAELARRLPTEGFAVDVVALRGGAVADELREAGVNVTVLDVRGKLDLAKWPRLVGLLRAGRYDILHTHLFHADLAGRPAAWSAGVSNVVHTVHVAERRFRPWHFAWARVMAGSCKAIICVSDGVRDHHARRAGLPASRYVVIHNGIDAARYARNDARRAELRERWRLGEQDVLCAFVGRLDAQKGIDVLLAAFERAAASDERLHLVLAGDGPQRGLVADAIAHSPGGRRIRLLGFTTDVPSVLSAADIFCQPSRWEGFCLAAAEAMAAGLPVAATDVAGLNEVVAAGRTGLLCPPERPEEVADAIERLVADAELRARLGAAGEERIARKFSVDRYIARHAALYASLASNPAQVDSPPGR